ncbi:DASH family cryptochrome [Coniella lustricola]|uniref:Cryptochrome DASH n=1 Tax=Coniella lustricola TaxID=2025994 RepID=A0A2T3AC33_9PEZI|nr:DASH family cryptochrome [Coniella lustricola]
MAKSNILIYLLRHDLRLSDNPVFHHLATHSGHEFTHLLPVYIFPAQQIEISGFIKDGSESPYPKAKSAVSKVWRTGPNRAKFIAQSVWDLRQNLESIGSGLLLRVGTLHDVLTSLATGFSKKELNVGAVWMTSEDGVEERADQRAVSAACKKHGIDFKLWNDEKYYVDDRDVSTPINEIPDIFTTYRKSVEPLRARPRSVLPKPEQDELPPYPSNDQIPPQHGPFDMPAEYDAIESALLVPLRDFMPDLPAFPEGAESAHPYSGGETTAHDRLRYLIQEGLIKRYKETRNGMLGPAFSTKLSAFLAQGCISARQVHHELIQYEEGINPQYEKAQGYGEGENDGTAAVRFELLWRDYMRLCTKKFDQRLFSVHGFRGHKKKQSEDEDDTTKTKWKTSSKEDALPDQSPPPEKIAEIVDRFNRGTTGMGLIDASQRELLHTGYTSNRARQNVASFLTKHLGIDWRFGAEWYEMLLVDYDVSSNWANWQYVAGVGNDPRGEARIFNPVKQAFDYDKQGEYVKTWVPELAPLEKLENIFQVATTTPEALKKAGLENSIMATDPVKRIDFLVDGKPKTNKRPFHRARGTRGPMGVGNDTTRPHNGNNSSPGPVAGYPDGNSHRGSTYRGRGTYNSGPRRGFHSGRGRGSGAYQQGYASGYFNGPPPMQMVATGRGGYQVAPGRGGYVNNYQHPYAAGPPSS